MLYAVLRQLHYIIKFISLCQWFFSFFSSFYVMHFSYIIYRYPVCCFIHYSALITNYGAAPSEPHYSIDFSVN